MQSFSNVFAGRKVLITGHTGFKGSWLTAWLLKLGAEVCGYSVDIPTSPSLFEYAGLEKKIRHEVGDIRDIERLTEVVQSFQPAYVFHLAAQALVSISYRDPLETFSSNVIGTATVLQVLRGVTWDCVATIITSDKCYENVEWPWGYRETDRVGGKDPYSASKGAAEVTFHAFFHSYFSRGDSSVRLATARAGNVIGGGDWAADRIVADCIRAWADNTTVEIRSPSATRPWQHVLEPISGYLTLAAELARDRKLHGESFNFGPRSEQNHTVAQLLKDLALVWGFKDPDSSFRITGNIPFHEAGLLKLNCDKALLDLRWESNLTYQECINITGEWYRGVVKSNEDALAITNNQIDLYSKLASDRNRIWQTA